MENVIGWLLIAMVPAVIAVGGIYLYRAWKRDVERKEQEAIAQAEQRAKEYREREKQRAKERAEFQARLDGKTVSANRDFNTDTVLAKVHDKKNNTTTYVTTHAEAPTQSVNNWSNDLLTTMIISDMLTNHKDVSAGTVKWKDDTPTITETYSKPSTDFGFDDSDSRKSSSSSFGSSDSSSSWGDSSSSSSDSGPSSDW